MIYLFYPFRHNTGVWRTDGLTSFDNIVCAMYSIARQKLASLFSDLFFTQCHKSYKSTGHLKTAAMKQTGLTLLHHRVGLWMIGHRVGYDRHTQLSSNLTAEERIAQMTIKMKKEYSHWDKKLARLLFDFVGCLWGLTLSTVFCLPKKFTTIHQFLTNIHPLLSSSANSKTKTQQETVPCVDAYYKYNERSKLAHR